MTDPQNTMSQAGEDKDLRKRKILYRSAHRGTKEMDLILGGYVARNIDNMTDAQLDEIEQIITLQDTDMLNWANGKTEITC